MHKCSCKCDIVASSEEKGLMIIHSTKNYGSIDGLYEVDEVTRGIRFCAGVNWYANNSYVRAFIRSDADDSFVYLIDMDATEFFDTSEIQGNVALLNVMQKDETKFIVAAVAYIGSGEFLYVSRVGDWKGILYDCPIYIPDYYKRFPNSEVIETDSSVSNELSILTKIKTRPKNNEERKGLYKLFANDLKAVGIIDKDIDIFDCISPTTESRYYITLDGNVLNTDLKQIISGFDLSKVDFSNVFSNYVFAFWQNDIKNNLCRAKIIILEDKANDLKDHFVFFKGGIKTGFSIPADKAIQAATASSTSVSVWKEDNAVPSYSFKLKTTGPGYFCINMDKMIFTFNNFKIPPLPKDTLTDQDADINSITGFSKFVTYMED